MKLIPNWRIVLKDSYSLKMMVIAFVLGLMEQALPLLDPFVVVHRGLFGLASVLVVPCAFVARLLAQESITNGK